MNIIIVGMIFSLGLSISIGFTLLIGVLLFFYMRRQMNDMNFKVQSLVNIIRDDLDKNRMEHTPPKQEPQNMVLSETKHLTLEPPLIQVSDNESESESESESDSESDQSDSNSISESVYNDDGEILKLDTKVIVDKLDTHESVEDNTDEDVVEDNIVDDDVEEEHDNIVEVVVEEEHDNIDEVTDTKPDISYKKLSVTQLRDIVSEKNLHDDPKKLKKKDLIELLD